MDSKGGLCFSEFLKRSTSCEGGCFFCFFVGMLFFLNMTYCIECIEFILRIVLRYVTCIINITLQIIEMIGIYQCTTYYC